MENMKLEDPEAAHPMLKQPLERVRDWFSGVRAGESHYGLLQGNDAGSSTDLPMAESSGRSSPFSRLSTSWRPMSPKAFFWLLVPSYIARIFGHATENSIIPAPNKTSYLNGLRGIASLIVALQHTIDGDVSDEELFPPSRTFVQIQAPAVIYYLTCLKLYFESI